MRKGMHSRKIHWFQKKILNRYWDNKRVLPWRDTFNPYRVLVSEVMSQQTQIERVVPKFENFIMQLPTITDLATCDKLTLFSLWSWLWFNSRAIRLQQSAQYICKNYDCIVPNERVLLLELPGIWPYTSASICAFAYNLSEPVIDTNIRRVLIFELWLDAGITNQDLEEIAKQCIPEWKSNDRHNALMDYWSIVATSEHTWIKPRTKQTRFKGSDRQVRWRILKKLTSWVNLDIANISENFPDKQVKSILKWMERDWLISLNKNQVTVSI